MGMEDKMLYFEWMANFRTTDGSETNYIVGGPGLNSYQITRNTLNFEAKAWWTLSHHKLCSTIRDNVLSPVCLPFVARLITGYDFNVAQFISRVISDWAVVCSDVILSFPFLLT